MHRVLYSKLGQYLLSRDGTVVRALASNHCGPGSILSLCHKWIEFVVGSSLHREFFSRFSCFLLSMKTNISKFQFDHDRGAA